MKNKLYFYFHAGSDNHGCEAIVRSTIKLLEKRPEIISDKKDIDEKYGISEIAEVKQKEETRFSVFGKMQSYIAARIIRNERLGYLLLAKYESKSFDKESIAFSIGGDNYCYGPAYNYHLEGLNTYLHKKNIKTVLWGCSIEPSTVTENMKNDFAKYDLITAREEISYQFLKKINKNTLKVCDPAFHLDKAWVKKPISFVKGKTVGINISPLIQKCETVSGITMLNYRNLIYYILEFTDYKIALIPHVVSPGNDDRIPLKELYREFAESGRVCYIDDCNCEQLKDIISECEMFIGARTHATIAAYSTFVPTLVIGYSSKAIGIAQDLFGRDKDYVLSVQNLKNKDDMVNAFKWLNQNKIEIREQLMRVIPAYKKTMDRAIEAINKLL